MSNTNVIDAEKRSRINDSTKKATTETLLTPRFYTTDFEAMNRLDLEPVR